MKENIVKSIFCCIGGGIVNLLGGWDIWLMTLVFLLFADVVGGIIKAILCKSEKSKSGGLNSQSMFRGGIKKIFIIMLIALGTLLDEIITPNGTSIRSAIAAYYITNESLSVLENIGACGVPLPKVLYKVLDVLKNDSDR